MFMFLWLYISLSLHSSHLYFSNPFKFVTKVDNNIHSRLKRCILTNLNMFFSFRFISWRLITLQYCSGFCHTLIWISHGFTCIPHPDHFRDHFYSLFFILQSDLCKSLLLLITIIFQCIIFISFKHLCVFIMYVNI